MTKSQQRAAIRTMISKYTKAANKSKKTATAALIAEGIYTKTGRLAKNYGGGLKTGTN